MERNETIYSYRRCDQRKPQRIYKNTTIRTSKIKGTKLAWKKINNVSQHEKNPAIKSKIPFTSTPNIMEDLSVHVTKYIQDVYIKIKKCRWKKSKKT